MLQMLAEPILPPPVLYNTRVETIPLWFLVVLTFVFVLMGFALLLLMWATVRGR